MPNITLEEFNKTIKMSDIIAQATDMVRIRPTQEKVNMLVEHLTNPNSKAIDGTTLQQLSFEDWTLAFDEFRKQLISKIGTDVNPDLKKEIQDKLINEQKDKAQNAFATSVDKIQIELESYKKDLLREIKSKKFPCYNAHIKEYLMTMTTVTKAPDMTARLIGATELALAGGTPLKYINVPLLDNYWISGRIDLVSALIERFALNRMEFKIEEAMKLQEFALEYYESIGVQTSRQILRYLTAFLNIVGLQKNGAQLFGNSLTMDFAMRMQAVQRDFEKAAGYDSLLES